MKTKQSLVPELLQQLQDGVRGIFESDAYREYLTTIARFHHYSTNNQLLIYLQRPDAERVASVRTWNQLGRYVRKGEHGIRILVPTPVKVKSENDGEEEEHKLMRFKTGHVFDISQTEGEPLPDISVSELTGGFENFEYIFQTLVSISPVPVRFDEINGGAKGFYNPSTQEIVIKSGMAESQTIKTLLHEMAHSMLHSKEMLKASGQKDRQTKEIEAESVAFVVSNALGLDTGDYSFAYVCSWSSGKEASELLSSLETIRDTSVRMIEKITTAEKQREEVA